MAHILRRLAVVLLFAAGSLSGQTEQKSQLSWLSGFDDAVKLAGEQGRNILIYFSGSDWCRPCMLLRIEVFETAAFREFAGDSLVLVQFDFPARAKNKLTEEQQKINDQMAERFNREGMFPKVLILDKNGNELGAIDGYKQSGAQAIISKLKSMMH